MTGSDCQDDPDKQSKRDNGSQQIDEILTAERAKLVLLSFQLLLLQLSLCGPTGLGSSGLDYLK